MDGMGKKCRLRRAFTSEFKAEIVEVCRQGDRTIGQVALARPRAPRPFQLRWQHVLCRGRRAASAPAGGLAALTAHCPAGFQNAVIVADLVGCGA